MTISISWLPVGHIAHGYRRIFMVTADGVPRHVVVLSPMPYQTVYAIQQMADGADMADPSLWWGISYIVKLLRDRILLNPDNPNLSDDGYLQMRPEPLAQAELLPLDRFAGLDADGQYVFARQLL